MKLILGTLLGAILFALPARADTIYDINATATITGNDACGGPCVETLTFSFMLEQVDPFNTTVLPGGTFTSSGPIPYGSGPMPGESPEADAFGDLRFFYSPPGGFGTDELDLAIGCVSTPFPCTPSLLGGATLYSCGDMTCVSDFCFGDCSNLAPNYEGGVASGPIVGTITVVNPPSATPEPGEASLLMLGVGLLGLAYRSGMRPGQFNIEGPEFRPLDGVLLAFLETVNFLDGSDGIAAGVGGIIAVAYAVFPGGANNLFASGIALILAGTCAGLLVYNFPPARIFGGDCGSNAFGFVVAFLALDFWRSQPLTAPTLLFPFLLSALPLLDAALAVIRRWRRRTSPLEGDRSHTYDLLLARGFSPVQVALLCYVVAIFLAGVSWKERVMSPAQACLVTALIFAALAVVEVWLGSLKGGQTDRRSPVSLRAVPSKRASVR